MSLSAVGVQLAIILAALAWKGLQLRQERDFIPDTGVRWTVAIALATLILTLLLDIPAQSADGPHSIATHLIQLGQNATIIATLLSLQLLYLDFRAPAGRRHSGQREILLAGTVLAIMAVIIANAIARNETVHYAPDALRRPEVATFYLTGLAYIIYADIAQVVYGLRYATRARSAMRRIALTITAIGMLLLLAASTLRAGLAISVLLGRGFSFPVQHGASWLITVGNPVLAIGLSYPVLAGRLIAGFRWWRAYRLHRDLDSLWWLVRWTFPELIQPPAPTDGEPPPKSTRFTRRPMTYIATRRRTECRDGYNQLQSSLNGVGPPSRQSRVRRAVGELMACSAPALMALSSDGMDARGRDSFDEDTRQLVAISRALRARDLSWCRQDPHAGGGSDTNPQGASRWRL